MANTYRIVKLGIRLDFFFTRHSNEVVAKPCFFAHPPMKTPECVRIHLCFSKARTRGLSACSLLGSLQWDVHVWGGDSARWEKAGASPTWLQCAVAAAAAAACRLFLFCFSLSSFAYFHRCLSPPTITHAVTTATFPGSFRGKISFYALHAFTYLPPHTLQSHSHLFSTYSCFRFPFSFGMSIKLASLPFSPSSAKANMTHPDWHLGSHQVPVDSSMW